MTYSNYRKVKVIGRGSFGAAVLVNAAEDSKQQFVIKEVNVTRMGKKEQEEAKKEIKLLATFNHPNIVQYHDSFIEQGRLCIVMDFAEGGDLAKLLKEQNGRLLSEDQAPR